MKGTANELKLSRTKRGGRVGQLGCDSSAATPVVGVRAYFLVLQALEHSFLRLCNLQLGKAQPAGQEENVDENYMQQSATN